MKIKNILLLLILCTAFISCKKVTDQVPSSIITPSNFYKTAADADNAINGCYDALQNSPSNMEVWGDGRADILGVTDRSGSNELQITSGNVSASNSYVNWSGLYGGINRCNSVIKNVPGIADAALDNRRDRIMGEAYFLRALYYFYLARTFENAPLILTPYENLSADFFPANSNRAALFAQIETDLKTAEPLVPDLPFGNILENKGKTTKAAIRSMMADVYLWQKKYQEAADAANLVINSPAKYTLVPGANFANMFTAKNSVESIMEIQFNYSYQEGNTNFLTDLFLPLGGSITAGNLRFQPSASLLSALPLTDNRASVTYKNTGAVPAPYRDVNVTYIAKYPGTTVGNVLYMDSNFIIYRLAEVILFRAEALNELGQTAEAKILLDQIRTRAGVTATRANSQSELRLAIEAERFAELAYEGKRYYDLVRTRRYAEVTGNADANWLRWPLPSSEIIRNKNLVQNPGY